MKSRMALFCSFWLVLLVASNAVGVNIDTGVREYVQPNGVKFEGQEWGDEFAMNSLTADGFVFWTNSDDGYYCYAVLDQEGEYTASRFRVGIDAPTAAGIPKGLQRSAERKAAIERKRVEWSRQYDTGGKPAGKSAAILTTPPANVTLGIILVEFSDVTHRAADAAHPGQGPAEKIPVTGRVWGRKRG